MIFERSKYIADFRAELGRTCIRFMSDFYTQQICLEFSPELIAVASIDLALYVHGLLNDLDMIPAWYMVRNITVIPCKNYLRHTCILSELIKCSFHGSLMFYITLCHKSDV